MEEGPLTAYGPSAMYAANSPSGRAQNFLRHFQAPSANAKNPTTETPVTTSVVTGMPVVAAVDADCNPLKSVIETVVTVTFWKSRLLPAFCFRSLINNPDGPVES